MYIRVNDLALLADGIRNNRDNFKAEVIKGELWAIYFLNSQCVLEWYVRDAHNNECPSELQEDVWNFVDQTVDVEDDIYDALEELSDNGESLPTP